MWEDASEAGGQGAIAIPLYDSVGRNCSGKPCDQAIVQQPFDPMALNSRYTHRAKELIAKFSRPGEKPFFLYMAYAHTHTPLAYSERFSNASKRPGFYRVFGNTLAEVDDSVGQIVDALDDSGLGDNTLIFLTGDKFVLAALAPVAG